MRYEDYYENDNDGDGYFLHQQALGSGVADESTDKMILL